MLNKTKILISGEGGFMKGYYTDSVYWGWVGNAYMAFPTPDEYVEYMREISESSCPRC